MCFESFSPPPVFKTCEPPVTEFHRNLFIYWKRSIAHIQETSAFPSNYWIVDCTARGRMITDLREQSSLKACVDTLTVTEPLTDSFDAHFRLLMRLLDCSSYSRLTQCRGQLELLLAPTIEHATCE